MTKIRRLRRLTSVAEIVSAYDKAHGRGSFRSLISFEATPRTKQQVSNYKRRGFLPPETILVVKSALEVLGYDAPPELFNVKAPRLHRAA